MTGRFFERNSSRARPARPSIPPDDCSYRAHNAYVYTSRVRVYKPTARDRYFSDENLCGVIRVRAAALLSSSGVFTSAVVTFVCRRYGIVHDDDACSRTLYYYTRVSRIDRCSPAAARRFACCSSDRPAVERLTV